MASEFNDETCYARVITERSPVKLQRYDHTAKKGADTAEDYITYIEQNHLVASITATELSADQLEITQEITKGGGRYEEHKPLSQALKSIFSRLGMTGVAIPEESGRVTFSDEPYFQYRDGDHRAQLQIFR